MNIFLMTMSVLSQARILLISSLVLSFLFPAVACYASADSSVNNSDTTRTEKSISDDVDDQIITRSKRAQGYYEQIEEVLEGDEFGKTEYVKSWRLIDSDDKQAREDKYPEWLIKFLEWLEKDDGSSNKDRNFSFNFFNLASGLEVLLWGLAIALFLFVIIKYREQIGSMVGLLKPSKKVESLPTTMFGIDIQNESIPEDVLGTARRHWQSGQPRLAIATLLRVSLVRLFTDHQCRFYDSDTEAECCQRIDQQVPGVLSSYMRLLVSAWQQIAYAHRIPSSKDFDTLCVKWQETFS